MKFTMKFKIIFVRGYLSFLFYLFRNHFFNLSDNNSFNIYINGKPVELSEIIPQNFPFPPFLSCLRFSEKLNHFI